MEQKELYRPEQLISSEGPYRTLSMRALLSLAAWSLVGTLFETSVANTSNHLSSHQILPPNFKPPKVFKNVNLVRSINLEKGYVRATVNVVVENTDKEPQSEYFLPFKAKEISHVGGLEVRDKKEPEKPAFSSEIVEYDTNRSDLSCHNMKRLERS